MESIDTIQKVIENNLCIGCGNCTYIDPNNYKMKFNIETGTYMPETLKCGLSIEKSDKTADVCPFSNNSKNETLLGNARFKGRVSNKRKFIGYYESLYAGANLNTEERVKSSSGGLTTWIIEKLIRRNIIDGAIVVTEGEKKPGQNNHPMFEYRVVDSIEDLRKSRKSKYYPVTLDNVYRQIKKSRNKRLAIVGIPCMIKSIQLIAQRDNGVSKSIIYYIGIVCGHMKTTYFSDYISTSLGVKPKNLKSIDFREKDIGSMASNYNVKLYHTDEAGVELKTKEVKNYSIKNMDWGLGLFKNPACEFCDDVLAECADITLGDAWIPKYENDGRGTNIVICRSKAIESILNEGNRKSEIYLEKIRYQDVIRSQLSGIKHRRLGLALRLSDLHNRKLFLKKRVSLWRRYLISRRYSKIIRLRNLITLHCFKHPISIIKSAQGREQKDVILEGYISEYKRLYKSPKIKYRRLKKLIDRYIDIYLRLP